MSKIKTVSFSDFGAVITGKTPSSSSPEDFGIEIPFVTPSDSFDSKYIMETSRFLSKVGAQKLNGKILPKDSVLVTCIGSAMGKIAMVSRESVTNQQINSIVINENFDSHYVYYCLVNNYKLIRNAAGGSTALPLLNKTEFEILKCSVHLLKEDQSKIVKVLSAMDSKIELNNRINTELEAMAKTLYDYWFVQFDFPDANGKPYKSSGGKMVYNPILKREIPEEWEVTVIADILGKTPPSNKVLNQEINVVGSIPVIDQSQDYICGFTDDMSALIMPTQPHVVFGDHTRAVKLVNFEYARGADGTQILLSNNSRMPGYLLYQAVSDIDLSNYGYARHFKFLKDSKIILPNETIATRYQQVVTPCYEKIKVGIFENQHLMRLRDWILPMLMNGQVTVQSSFAD